MRTLDYALREGWRGLRRSGIAGVLAVAATGLAILVLGAMLLLTSNVERLMAQWLTTAEFSVFLSDDATSEQRGLVEAEIDRSGIAVGRSYLSKADALTRFRREFADLDALSSSLEGNPFPASIEVRVAADADRDGQATATIGRIATLAGVADVRYDREWLSTLTTGLSTVRGVGWTMALLVALAAGATVASVVRLGLQSRYQEIEIMQLVGSPVAFIQGPFMAEGFLQGGIGALGAVALLGAGYAAALRWWGAGVSTVLDGASLQFLSPLLLFLLLLGGMLVGALGGFVASRHAR
jgi:cell division transport system permease protein